MIKFTFINSKSALVNAERGLKPVGLRLDAPAAAVDPQKPGAKAGRQSMYLDELAFKLLTSHKIVGMNAATIDQQGCRRASRGSGATREPSGRR